MNAPSHRPAPSPPDELPDPLICAICYPREWWRQPGRFDEAVAALAAIERPDGGAIEVVVAPYEEPHERRTARGAAGGVDWRDHQLAIDEFTADVFARMHVALALDLPVDIVDRAPRLRWVQALGAGTDQFVPCGFGAAGVVLTSSSGSNARGIAEFAFGRVIEHAKRFAALRDLQRSRTWDPQFGEELAGQTLGLIGLGNICASVAPLARAFGMRVLATRRSAGPGDTDPRVDEIYPMVDLHGMLARCDAVIAAVPESPGTRGMIDAAAIGAMKPGAFFCNVGRGSLVDEPTLVAALQSGHLSGAALDVASVEPLPADDPLWSAPNLSLSFHNAAVPAAMFANVHRIFADNVERFVRGERLHNVVA